MRKANQDNNWIVQRRRLGDEGPHSWDTLTCAPAVAGGREEAEHLYQRMMMYIQCHEMRLLAPDGELVLYCRDPSSFHRPARAYDEVLAERKRLASINHRRRFLVHMTKETSQTRL